MSWVNTSRCRGSSVSAEQNVLWYHHLRDHPKTTAAATRGKPAVALVVGGGGGGGDGRGWGGEVGVLARDRKSVV